jgi:uncharacterized protein YqgV (UPF0045/DUF77 family)
MKINAAIQLLPLGDIKNKLPLIDKAIGLIQGSGLSHKVCPFETVVEGETEKVYKLIKSIQEETLKAGCDELLINIKIHAANRDLAFEEKLVKYS